ncbi:MAG: GH3 auxin-responsive promoter family protein [Clostridia bacterium]|nr:GH3 auxin-responsive promoter family protein [Clostridia bacterium]
MSHKFLNSLAMRVMVIKGNGSLKRLARSAEKPMEQNEALLREIIKKNRNTEFGRLHGFDKIRSIEDFRKNVPVSGYEDYVAYIDRMKEGEENLITASKVLGYSRTSGSSGVPKYIPATSASLKAYVRYTWTRALALGAAELKKQGKKYKPGRGVYLSPATNETLPNGLPCSNIAEIGARNYGRFYPFILMQPSKRMYDMHDGDYIYCMYRFALADPDATFFFSVFFSVNVSQLAYLRKNWRTIVDDIEKGGISKDVKLTDEARAHYEKYAKADPARAAYLREQFEKGFDSTLFRRLWPNLAVICGIGNASFKSAAEHIRGVAGDVPFDFSIYGASEGLVAACWELESTDMQLLTDSCFYEFVPFGEDGEERYLTLDQVKAGEKYELLITTFAGLYRYRLKDVIEVKGFRGKCPLISFVFRKGQMFNIAGEKFSEEDARTTIEMFEKAHGVEIGNWLFYQDESVQPNRYALVVESDADVDWDAAVDEIEEYIGKCNKRYPSQRDKFYIDRLVIRHQIPGTHAAWAKRCIDKGASFTQVKPVHSLDNPEKAEFFLSRIEK